MHLICSVLDHWANYRSNWVKYLRYHGIKHIELSQSLNLTSLFVQTWGGWVCVWLGAALHRWLHGHHPPLPPLQLQCLQQGEAERTGCHHPPGVWGGHRGRSGRRGTVAADLELNSGGNYLYFSLCLALINTLHVVLNEINAHYWIITTHKNTTILVKLNN